MTDELRATLASIEDPQLDLAIGEAGLLGDVAERPVRVELRLPAPGWPTTDVLTARIRDAAGAEVALDVRTMDQAELRGLRDVLRARMDAAAQGTRSTVGEDLVVPGFLTRGAGTRVLAISSGKGGVGKSTVTVNVAIALAAAGHTVGVLDADVYGFSVARMVAAASTPIVLGDTVVPSWAHGVRWLSMGWFVDDDQPVIWRGPLLHKAITQFLTEAWWGEPDFLVIDMPPGTGDVALTLSQVAPTSEVYVVTTPQPADQRVAQRSALAARKLRLAVRGVIENMSAFTADDGTRYELFGRGGGTALADDLGVPLLAQVPFDVALREGGDDGLPLLATAASGAVPAAFGELARRLAAQGPARVYRQELRLA